MNKIQNIKIIKIYDKKAYYIKYFKIKFLYTIKDNSEDGLYISHKKCCISDKEIKNVVIAYKEMINYIIEKKMYVCRELFNCIQRFIVQFYHRHCVSPYTEKINNYYSIDFKNLTQCGYSKIKIKME